jgi:hypothetical protein
MEKWRCGGGGVAGNRWIWGLRVIICGKALASGRPAEVSNRNSKLKLLVMRDLSSSEVGRSLQKYRTEICKLLIMRDLIFSGIGKRREKYRIEICVSGVGKPGETSELRKSTTEFRVTSAGEDGLSKIFTDYGSTRRAKLRTVACVHGVPDDCAQVVVAALQRARHAVPLRDPQSGVYS